MKRRPIPNLARLAAAFAAYEKRVHEVTVDPIACKALQPLLRPSGRGINPEAGLPLPSTRMPPLM